MKGLTREIERRAVTEPVDDIGMTHAVERDRFVAKIFDERVLKLWIGRALQVDVERLDDDLLWRAGRCGHVARDINFGVAAAPQTFENVVAPVEPCLLELQFTHSIYKKSLRPLRSSSALFAVKKLNRKGCQERSQRSQRV